MAPWPKLAIHDCTLVTQFKQLRPLGFPQLSGNHYLATTVSDNWQNLKFELSDRFFERYA
nr:MAG: hypothetical protein EDM05_04565 [Leptolyngbya sp. IPPAS B-1204]